MILKLYGDPGSGSYRRSVTVARHLTLAVEEVFIDLLAGENRQERFRSLNPNGMVPVLETIDSQGNRTVLSEAAAINIHLCEFSGDTALWPTGPARDQVRQWMFWAAEHFRQPAPIYFEEKVIAGLMGKPPNESRLAEADRLLALHGPVLDRHLADREFVVGDHVTLADIDLAAPLSQMPRSGVPYDRFPNIMRWTKNLAQACPAWHQAGVELDDRMNAALSQPEPA